ncbi:MAG: MCE family protein [Nocardioidaceae bacterium]|nr:MCE family protein [Nocardioidaceae bacterium]MCL2611777.1 MCE family protein [Nocardioidaceae bacterium]
MRAASDARVLRLGTITLVLMVLIGAATFNLGKLPGFHGTTYYAQFSDASGLHKGDVVQVGGIQVGQVNGIALDGPKVDVTFQVDGGVELGSEPHASIEVYNLLGEKFLDVTPSSGDQLAKGSTIPLDHTDSAYDIVGVLSDLTGTTQKIDTKNLSDALNVVSGTLNDAAPEVRETFRGIARLSRTVASRDNQLQSLFKSSQQVSKVLDARSQDIVDLMKNSSLVFKELIKRKQAIHKLLINARLMAKELRGVATDNAAQIKPALRQVQGLLGTLVRRKKQLKAVLHQLGPYVSILSNIVGTGPWFDAYASNLAAVATGEFVPGFNTKFGGNN